MDIDRDDENVLPGAGLSQDQILAEMPGEADYRQLANTQPTRIMDDCQDALPVLTADQEWHLFRKMCFLRDRAGGIDVQSGDLENAHAIRDQLVRANLRLVSKVLQRFNVTPAWRDDLFSDGQLALWRAVDRYDYRQGNRFSTFAYRVICNAMNSRLKSESKLQFIARLPDDDRFENHPDPRPIQPPASLFAGLDLQRLLESLPPRESEVVCLRCGIGQMAPLSLTKVGARLGISKTRVRQLEIEGYSKLRPILESIAS